MPVYPDQEPHERICCECGETKPVEDFAVLHDERFALCRDCTAYHDWCERKTTYLRCYGMTARQYLLLVIDQGQQCAICRRQGVQLVVDHSHETGEVRGLLCHDCNLGLGRFKDSQALLARAACYLTQAFWRRQSGQSIIPEFTVERSEQLPLTTEATRCLENTE